MTLARCADGRVAAAPSPRPVAAPLAWSRHPASFDTWALAAAGQAIRVPPGGLVIDPFAGTAATGTFAVARGERFWGVEAHPLMAEVATLKFARPGAPDALREVTRAVTGYAASVDRRPEDEHELILRSIGREQAGELGALRDGAANVGGEWAAHLRWATVGALRDLVGPGWPSPRPRPRVGVTRSATELVLRRADQMAADLLLAPRRPEATVVCGDARCAACWEVASGTADGCVTSPPYLNQVHWGETLRLEAAFLGAATTWRELLDLSSRRLVASSTQQATVQRAADARDALESLTRLNAAAAPLVRRLERIRAGKPRGKAYDRLLPCYLVDMTAVLRNILIALRPGARAALLVGDSAPYDVLVDTPSLLATAACEIGFDVIEDRYVRARGGRWAGVGARHARRLSERLLVLERPVVASQLRLPGLESHY